MQRPEPGLCNQRQRKETWYTFYLCVLFSDISGNKTSQTGTRCPLQHCYITRRNHILVFTQGAKEASRRDSSREPFLWRRPLIKLSSLDQTVQYRYITNTHHVLQEIYHWSYSGSVRFQVSGWLWCSNKVLFSRDLVRIRSKVELWVSTSFYNSQTQREQRLLSLVTWNKTSRTVSSLCDQICIKKCAAILLL